MERVDVEALTTGQIEQIEIQSGYSLDQWGSVPSRARLFVTILSVATGRDVEEFRAMKITELMDLVNLEPDDPKA